MIEFLLPWKRECLKRFFAKLERLVKTRVELDPDNEGLTRDHVAEVYRRYSLAMDEELPTPYIEILAFEKFLLNEIQSFEQIISDLKCKKNYQ